MPDGWKVLDEAPAPKPAASGWSVVEDAPAVEAAPAPTPEEWRKTDFGFRVKNTVTHTGQPSVQREDGLVWYGPDQGNTGRPGWFDAKGMRGPDVPVKTFAEVGTDRGLGIIDRLLNRQQEFRNRVAQQGVLKTAAQDLGNQSILPTAPGTLIRQIREGFGYRTPMAAESYLPDPTAARAVKGALDTVVAPAQLLGNAVSPGTVGPAVNQFVTNEQQWMDQNFRPSQTGEMLGQALPFVLTGGGTAAAQGSAKLLPTLAKSAGTGAVMAPLLTPEANVQSPSDYWGRKGKEAALGGTVGAVIPAGAKAVEAIADAAKVIHSAPAPGAFLEELGQRFQGKTPGQAIQDAAHQKYNAAWDEFKKAIAPVDAAAGNVAVDYTPAIQKMQTLLGGNGPKSPVPLGKETQETIERLLVNLQEAQAGGNVDSSFAGAIETIKWLGAEQRRLAVKHGDTAARELLGGVRDSILDAMTASDPNLSKAAEDARRVFATRVAPLFDKSEGGNFLTQIRDSATPGDLLVSGNQGQLARVKPDKAKIIAEGSSADPMLWSYLDAAIKQGDGNPRAFADSLKKVMPVVEAIADPKTVEAFQGMIKVANGSKTAGRLINFAAAAVPGYHSAGASLGLLANFNPAITGPGLIWRALQSPASKKLLSFAAGLPANSPHLELLTKDLVKTIPTASAKVSPLRPVSTPLPAAADAGTEDRIAQK